jgi:CBS-domain-containing membrane protein
MKAQPEIGRMALADAWTLGARPPPVVDPETPLPELVERLAEGALPDHLFVVNADGRLCGTLDAADLVAALFPLHTLEEEQGRGRAERARFRPTRVREVMDLRPRYVTPATRVGELVRLIIRHRVTELPVVDQRMRLLGRIGARDLFAACLRARRASPQADAELEQEDLGAVWPLLRSATSL